MKFATPVFFGVMNALAWLRVTEPSWIVFSLIIWSTVLIVAVIHCSSEHRRFRED